MIDIEKKLIGLLLYDSDLYFMHYDRLFDDLFTYDNHKKIFHAISAINKNGGLVDAVSISEEIKNGRNIIEEIQLLESEDVFNLNIENVIDSLHESYRKKVLKRLASLLEYNQNKSSEETIKIITDTLSSIISNKSNIKEFSTVIDGLIEHIKTKKEGITGIETGFTDYDEHTMGLQPEDLIIVAGETSQGKTSFVVSMIKEPLINNNPILFVSLEMSQNQLASRLLSNVSNISSKDLMYNNLSENEINDIEKELRSIENIPLYIDDSGSSDYESIVNSIKKHHIQKEIKVVVIDYIQLVNNRTKGGTKEQEVGDIIRGFKNLAKELKITIIGLSQLSRNKENPIPTLSRLRQSGQIEEAADQVILLFRPEYYNIGEYDFEGTVVNTHGIGFVFIAKGRNVGIKNIIMRFKPELTKWYNAYEVQTLDNPF